MDIGRHLIGQDSSAIFSDHNNRPSYQRIQFQQQLQQNHNYESISNSLSCPAISQLPDDNTIQELFKKCPAKQSKRNTKLAAKKQKLLLLAKSKQSNGNMGTQARGPDAEGAGGDMRRATRNNATSNGQQLARKQAKGRGLPKPVGSTGTSNRSETKNGPQSPHSSDNDSPDRNTSARRNLGYRKASGVASRASSSSSQGGKYKVSENLQQLMHKSHAQSHQNCLNRTQNVGPQKNKTTPTNKTEAKTQTKTKAADAAPLRVKFASSVDVKFSDSDHSNVNNTTSNTKPPNDLVAKASSKPSVGTPALEETVITRNKPQIVQQTSQDATSAPSDECSIQLGNDSSQKQVTSNKAIELVDLDERLAEDPLSEPVAPSATANLEDATPNCSNEQVESLIDITPSVSPLPLNVGIQADNAQQQASAEAKLSEASVPSRDEEKTCDSEAACSNARVDEAESSPPSDDLINMATDQQDLTESIAKISLAETEGGLTKTAKVQQQDVGADHMVGATSTLPDVDDNDKQTSKSQVDEVEGSQFSLLGSSEQTDVANDEILADSDPMILPTASMPEADTSTVTTTPASTTTTVTTSSTGSTSTTASIIHFSMVSDNESDQQEVDTPSLNASKPVVDDITSLTILNHNNRDTVATRAEQPEVPVPRKRTSLLAGDNSSFVSPSAKPAENLPGHQTTVHTKTQYAKPVVGRAQTEPVTPNIMTRHSTMQLSMLSDDDDDNDEGEDVANNLGVRDKLEARASNLSMQVIDPLPGLDEFSTSLRPTLVASRPGSSNQSETSKSSNRVVGAETKHRPPQMGVMDPIVESPVAKTALIFPQLNEGLSSDAESAGDDVDEDEDDHAMDADVEADDEDFDQEDDDDDEDDDEDDEVNEDDDDSYSRNDHAASNDIDDLFGSLHPGIANSHHLDHKQLKSSSTSSYSNLALSSYANASGGPNGGYVMNQPDHEGADLQPNGDFRHSATVGYSSSNGQSYWPNSSAGYHPVPSTSRGHMNGMGASSNSGNRSNISNSNQNQSNSLSFGRDEANKGLGSNQRLSSDTDNETDRLLGSQRNEQMKLAAAAAAAVAGSASTGSEASSSTLNQNSSLGDSLRGSNSQREILIEGNLFNVKYLGSTHADCENRSDKEDRIHQAEMAVQQVKYRNGESQVPIEVQLFISTEKIMVLDDKNRKIMMDHSLRTVSYIADIGEAIVLIVRKRATIDAGTELARPIWKYSCHVFESPDSHTITKSISQAFQVAFNELMKANGGGAPSDLSSSASYLGKELDYQEILNSQEMSTDELEMFAKKENQREVIVPKEKGEILGIGIVESGWGSVLPTVVIASLKQGSPAYRCKNLFIGDQILSINGISLVGLPLAECQDILSQTKKQTVARLYIVPCSITVEVKIKRPDTKYQLGFSVQNGVICSLLRGGIAERGGVRVGHRIMSINGTTVVGVPHEKIVSLLASSVGEIHMKTCLTSLYRLILGEDNPVHF